VLSLAWRVEDGRALRWPRVVLSRSCIYDLYRDDSRDLDRMKLAADLLENIFRYEVHNGSIAIDDRSSERIVLEFLYDLRLAVDSRKEQNESLDYRYAVSFLDSILERATIDAESGKDELAVSFYAIWLEHFLNRALTSALRRKGYTSKHIIPLIRELRLRTKAFSLWKISDLPPIDEADLNLIDSIVNHRNSFLHYKWIEHDQDEGTKLEEQLHLVVDRAKPLIGRLIALESSAVWFGRETELIQTLRENMLTRHMYQERSQISEEETNPT
jgi:hypothetical protein